MKKLKVEFVSKPGYDIILSKGFDDLKNYIKQDVRYFIITDENVAGLYLDDFVSSIFNDFPDHYIFKPGENNKIYDTVNECYKALIQSGHDRKSIIIALGGGVTGDIAGFVASTYMRGIEYIQVPTTLLAMVDSSVGGKTGYDFEGTKNLIGTFHQPSLVYANLLCLHSLPPKEFSTGMAECIKHALISDREYLEFIKKNLVMIKTLKYEYIEHLVLKSCEIKSVIVSADEKESGKRALLNFGHTIGHAIEAASGYDLTHGQAVAVGMNAAITHSEICENDKKMIRDLIRDYGLLLSYPVSIKDIYDYIRRDKKFTSGRYTFILLKSIGEAYINYYNDIEDILNIAKKVTFLPE